MKKILNKLIISFNILILGFFSTNGQTNVSGIIDTNTTWTLANSPYIVVDTIFINSAILAIEPGVVVKFENDKLMVLIQASLIAIGNFSDSISFTSNSSNPTNSSWQGIFLSVQDSIVLSYCNIKYANNGIGPNLFGGFGGGYIALKNCSFYKNNEGLSSNDFSSQDCFIDSCSFFNNGWAIHLNQIHPSLKIKNSKIIDNSGGISLPANSIVENCIIDSNDLGIELRAQNDTIINCQITNNSQCAIRGYFGNGSMIISNNIIENNYVGCEFHVNNFSFNCNRVCNNISYAIDMVDEGDTINISNNYWCSSDSTTIASKIHDGNDQQFLSILNFIPFDTLQCYLNNSIYENEIDNLVFEISPNPVCDYLKLKTTILNSTINLKIYNVYGELEFFSTIKENNETINASSLSSGIHFLQLSYKDKIAVRKFLKL